jgi:4-diphosphocytidyl-2-C-methyl-D-erythritol kinase
MSVWPAPAKLNLFLHVTGKRADGYHELQTLFQILDWGDELQIECRDDGQIERQNVIEEIPESEDLSIKAAQLLKAETGCKKGANIYLSKNIPLGSGLGGGSSDAATVLHALNELWGCGLNTGELASMGLRLGADVPLFVYGHSAWAEGIGERLQNYSMEESWYVLVFPEVFVSTQSVFGDPALKRDSRLMERSQYAFDTSRNDCQEVVFKLFPELQKVMRNLIALGTPRLTGTGSCIFIPVNGKNEAIRITNDLKSLYNVRAVRGVNNSPLLARLPREVDGE